MTSARAQTKSSSRAAQAPVTPPSASPSPRGRGRPSKAEERTWEAYLGLVLSHPRTGDRLPFGTYADYYAEAATMVEAFERCRRSDG